MTPTALVLDPPSLSSAEAAALFRERCSLVCRPTEGPRLFAPPALRCSFMRCLTFNGLRCSCESAMPARTRLGALNRCAGVAARTRSVLGLLFLGALFDAQLLRSVTGLLRPLARREIFCRTFTSPKRSCSCLRRGETFAGFCRAGGAPELTRCPVGSGRCACSAKADFFGLTRLLSVILCFAVGAAFFRSVAGAPLDSQ